VRSKVRRMLDLRVDHGAAYLGHAASSSRKNAPPLADLADTQAGAFPPANVCRSRHLLINPCGGRSERSALVASQPG
jgi:hypothetical protein